MYIENMPYDGVAKGTKLPSIIRGGLSNEPLRIVLDVATNEGAFLPIVVGQPVMITNGQAYPFDGSKVCVGIAVTGNKSSKYPIGGSPQNPIYAGAEGRVTVAITPMECRYVAKQAITAGSLVSCNGLIDASTQFAEVIPAAGVTYKLGIARNSAAIGGIVEVIVVIALT